jgi:hypothetical protein
VQIWNGAILIYDREARGDVVRAFKAAGWKPGKHYSYGRKEEAGQTSRYYTHGSREEVARLNVQLAKIWNEGSRGWEAYLEEDLTNDDPTPGFRGAACPAGLESRELTALHAHLLEAPPARHGVLELELLTRAAMGPLVRFYMRRGVKVCSGIAPAFVLLARAAGFQAEARDSGRHVTALVALDDGSVYRVDPSAVQFHPDLLAVQGQGFFEGDPEFDNIVWALVERVQADPMFAVTMERVR